MGDAVGDAEHPDHRVVTDRHGQVWMWRDGRYRIAAEVERETVTANLAALFAEPCAECPHDDLQHHERLAADLAEVLLRMDAENRAYVAQALAPTTGCSMTEGEQ